MKRLVIALVMIGGARIAHADCANDTDVLGYRCLPYGGWGNNLRIRHVFIEMGINVRQFANMLGDQQTNVTFGNETFAYRVVTPPSMHLSDVAVTTDWRAAVDMGHGLYVGLDSEVGGLAAPGAAMTEMTSVAGSDGDPQLSQGHGVMVGYYGVFGIRGNARSAAFSLEMAGGGRTVMYVFDTAYNADHQSSTITATTGVIEVRARAEVWLNPWLTGGLTIGTSVLDRDEWLTGMYFGIHSRAFGGSR